MTASPRTRRLGRKPVIIVTAVIVVLAVIYAIVMTIGLSRRVAVPIQDVWMTEPDRLTVVVNTCNGEPEATTLREGSEVVEVRVVSRKTWGSGEDCLDSLEIQLDAPLGDRILFDLEARIQVEIGAPLW